MINSRNHQPFSALSQEKLETLVSPILSQCHLGKLPHYIPLLAEVNPLNFALQIQGVNQEIYSLGDSEKIFPLMSVIKPFLLLYLLSHFGESLVFNKVGLEPSNKPFNSLEQLQEDCGFPRNPMINSGALALVSLLPENDPLSCCETLRDWLNKNAGCQLFLDQPMLASVNSTSKYRNQAIAFELASAGIINDWQISLEIYNHICCLSGTIRDLAQLGMLLVDCPNLSWLQHCRTVKALMMTSGLYQASGPFAVRVGLPTKSGVSGIILSLVPHQGVMACYSPPLDAEGNSLVGLLIVEKLSQTLGLSIFD